MKIKATTIERHESLVGDGPQCSGRLEIQWEDEGEWLNFGINYYSALEWELLLSLMVLGARQAGVEFTHEDLTENVKRTS